MELSNPILPPGLVSTMVEETGTRVFEGRTFSKRNQERVARQILKRTTFPTKNKRPKKRFRAFSRTVFESNQLKLLEEPLPIPELTEVESSHRKVQTLSHSGIPCNVIRIRSLPAEVIRNIPPSTLAELRKQLPVMENFAREKLLEITNSLHLQEFILRDSLTKFQLLAILYELIDKEFYALWLSKVFKHEQTGEISSGIFSSYRFSIFEPDFALKTVQNIKANIEFNGGIVEKQVDEMTDFIIFRQMQEVDLSHLPHVRPITLKQLKKLEELKLTEFDLKFDNIVSGTEDDSSDNMDTTADHPIFDIIGNKKLEALQRISAPTRESMKTQNYSIFGFTKYHSSKVSPLLQFFAERFELYFMKKKGEISFSAQHLYWKNQDTLERCRFFLRKQQGRTVKTASLPLEFPEHSDVTWILLVEPLHEYFFKILEDALSSCVHQGVQIASPVE